MAAATLAKASMTTDARTPLPFSPLRAWWAVALLLLAYAAAFIDRQVLSLLVDPIKHSLALEHDWQISLLQGMAFMGTYIAFGPVFGRWADTGHRRTALVFAAVMWSLSTVACGFATGFWTMFLARAGVGAAEAALAPVAWSCIADSFPPERLPRALSVYLLGPYLGQGLALIGGGYVLGAIQSGALAGTPVVGTMEPWAATFVVVGLPGLIIAAMLFTMREPVRGAFATASAMADTRHYTLGETLAYLWQHRGFFLRFFFGMGFIVLSLYGLPSWVPTYLSRAFGMDRAEAGKLYGWCVLVAGCTGVLLGPWLGAQLQRRGMTDAMPRVALLGALLLVPACAVLALATSATVVLAAAAFAGVCYSLPQAMAASVVQVIVPNRMRGVITSVYVFAVTIMGLGVAPTAIALVTDYVFRDPARVGQSVGLVCGAAAALGAVLLWQSLAPFRRLLRA